MSISRVKVWSAGEVLLASDQNAEFNNILNNGVDLWSPAAKAADMNGFELILDADADTSITSDTDDRIDFRVGGTDSLFIGHASGNTGGFLTLDPLAFTSTASTDIARFRVANTNALTVPAGTTAIAASVFFEEPNLTATGTITRAATVYVEAAPTEGGTANYALWVDAGDTRLDGDLDVQGGDLTTTATTFNLLNATATTINFAGAATTLTMAAATATTTIRGTTVAIGENTGTTTFSGSTIPQNSKSADYTTVAADANKHILHPTADNNARTFTIDSNANVPYPIGTAITFVNEINTLTIAITSDTLVLAGTGGTGSRTLAAMGIATALKKTSTSWIISGTGLS